MPCLGSLGNNEVDAGVGDANGVATVVTIAATTIPASCAVP